MKSSNGKESQGWDAKYFDVQRYPFASQNIEWMILVHLDKAREAYTFLSRSDYRTRLHGDVVKTKLGIIQGCLYSFRAQKSLLKTEAHRICSPQLLALNFRPSTLNWYISRNGRSEEEYKRK